MTLALEICQALANVGVLSAVPSEHLVWCEYGWFATGQLGDGERPFWDCLNEKGYRTAFVASVLEALQQATLWQIGHSVPRQFGPVKARPRLYLVR